MCSKVLRTPAEDLERYNRSEYPENHDTACFMRCTAILNGAYDDETGVNMDVVYGTYGALLTAEEYTEESEPCLALRDGVECYCMKAYKPLMCLREQFKKRNAI